MSAPPSRALCVSSDPALRQVLRRSMRAPGLDVDFAVNEEEACRSPAAQLVVLDVDAAPDAEALLRRLPSLPSAQRRHVVLVGERVQSAEVLPLMRALGCDQLVARDGGLTAQDLVVTSGKILGGDIFGLEKYVTFGTRIHEQVVATFDDKRAAIDALAAFARSVGGRRQLVARVESAADELLMNAVYDAPVASGRRRDEVMAQFRGGRVDWPALVRHACDGDQLLVSVRDAFGTLRKEDVVDHLERGVRTRGEPAAQDPQHGAGLGMYLVLMAASRLVINLAPGIATEVICSFDLGADPRTTPAGARALSIFLGHA